MRKHTYIALFFLIINIWITHSSYGFGNKLTHPAITSNAIGESAIDGYLKDQLGMVNGIQTQLRYQPEWYEMYIEYRLHRGGYSLGGNNRTVSEWLKSGSVIEDEDLDILFDFLPSIRPRHHFHDPLRNSGLDDKTDHSNYANSFAWATNIYPGEFDVTGQSAMVWAIKGTDPYREPTTNAQSWVAARDDFHAALTDPNSLWREYYLATMFLDLGSVAHMIEDMGVPAHTRNDFLFGHYNPPLSFGNDFENWVERIIKNDGNQCPWSGSSPVVFDKLAKYFDSNEYLGSYLGDGVLPPNTWGLSECSNYQFLSTSTMFGCSEIKYQFPNPVKEHLVADLIVPVTEGRKIYFNGENYGVSHIARESYTYYFADEHGVYDEEIDSTNTTDDINVFEDYANITVPRTINYATGLINYFFRGKLSISQTDCNNGKIIITITNKSTNSDVNQILKGGTFTLYWDNSTGIRNQVTDFTVYQPGTEPSAGLVWNSTTQLNYDESTKAVLTPPTTQDVNYILVYEGIISANPASPDTDDTRQIATRTFSAGTVSCDAACPTPPQYFYVSWRDSVGSTPSYAKANKVPGSCCWIGMFTCGTKEGLNVVLAYNECSGWQAWYGTSSCGYSNGPIAGYTWSKSLSCGGGTVQLTNNASGNWEKIEFYLLETEIAGLFYRAQYPEDYYQGYFESFGNCQSRCGELNYFPNHVVNFRSFLRHKSIAMNAAGDILVGYSRVRTDPPPNYYYVEFSRMRNCEIIDSFVPSCELNPLLCSEIFWDRSSDSFVVGYFGSSPLVYKMSPNGDVLWSASPNLPYPTQIFFLTICPNFIEAFSTYTENGHYYLKSCIISQSGNILSYNVIDEGMSLVMHYGRRRDWLCNLWECNNRSGSYYIYKNDSIFPIYGSGQYLSMEIETDITCNRVFVCCGAFGVGCFNADSAETIWSRTDLSSVGYPRYFPKSNILFVTEGWGEIIALDANDGHTICILPTVQGGGRFLDFGNYVVSMNFPKIFVGNCSAIAENCSPPSGGRKAKIEWFVRDENNTPISGAVVGFSYTGALIGTANVTTNEMGIATWYTECTSSTGEIVFTATDIIKSGHIYDASLNLCSSAACTF